MYYFYFTYAVIKTRVLKKFFIQKTKRLPQSLKGYDTNSYSLFYAIILYEIKIYSQKNNLEQTAKKRTKQA